MSKWPDDHWFLREWRNGTGRTIREVAHQAALGASSLNNWELGQARPDIYDLRTLDRYYKAGGALVSLAQAGRHRCDVLPPRQRWWLHFRTDTGPVWAWIRPEGDRPVQIQFSWGIFVGEATANPNGTVFTAPVSARNPAALVEANEPVWIDLGEGTLPPYLDLDFGEESINRMFGIQISEAMRDVLATELKKILEHGYRRSLFDLIVSSWQSTDGQPETRDPGVQDPAVPRTTSSEDSPFIVLSGNQYQRIREQACYDRLSVRDKLDEHRFGPPIRKSAISRLEQGRVVADRNIRSRLDAIYGCDGRTACDPVKVTRQHDWAVVEVPDYWYGPVWIRLQGAAPLEAPVRFRWHPWERLYNARIPSLVTLEAAGPARPLCVDLPRSWTLEAGMGYRPEATEINDGWDIVPGAANYVSALYRPVLLQFARAYGSGLRRLLRRLIGNARASGGSIAP